jgi:hypothetical protein
MLPTFIGIGAPKAGTTWLANALDDHPGICMSEQKEPDFFGYMYTGHTLDWYEGLFQCDGAPAAIGEFSTGYLADEDAPGRVVADLPDVRLIAVLRDPVSQLYSHYWHLQRQNFHRWNGQAGQIPFERALEKYEDLLVRPARYAEHLERWLGYFPRERFLIHLFDDVKADRDAVLRETFAFVGADPDWRPATADDTGTTARQGTSPRSALAARVSGRVYSTLNRYAYMPLKRTIGEERAMALKDRLRVRAVLEAAFRKKGYPPMDSETRRQLAGRFDEPNRRLGEIIGRDLSHWGR